MWTCPKCGTKVDPSFEVCWSCGTSSDGIEDPTFVRADSEEASESPLDLDMPEGEQPIPEPLNPSAGELVEAYQAMDMMQAKFLADRLTELGIPAVSDLHDMHDALGSMSSVPRVWVRAGDFARARDWLLEYDRQNRAEHGGVKQARRCRTGRGQPRDFSTVWVPRVVLAPSKQRRPWPSFRVWLRFSFRESSALRAGRSEVPDLVLASTSVYRRTLLARLGLPFRCVGPTVDEETLKDPLLAPRALAEKLARAKAESVASEEAGSVILGGDQLVECVRRPDARQAGQRRTGRRAAPEPLGTFARADHVRGDCLRRTHDRAYGFDDSLDAATRSRGGRALH